MAAAFRRRQLVTAAAVGATARPPSNYWLGVPAMAAGLLAGELAPVLLGATALDGARELRRDHPDLLGLGLAAASGAGAAYFIRQSAAAGRIAEAALREELGQTYADALPGGGPAPPAALRSWPVPTREPSVERITDVAYGEDPKQRLDIHRPRRPVVGGAPVLVHLHSGMWMSGDKRSEGRGLLSHMAARGWWGVNVNYRFAQHHAFPAQIVDVKRALAWVREHGPGYGADPSYVAVCGESSGAHLAALAALTPNEPELQPGFTDVDTSVDAAVPHFGIFDLAAASGTDRARKRRDQFLAPYLLQQDPSTDLASFERASPLWHADAGAPPFFLTHGTHDTGVEVEESRHFVARLREVSRQPVVYAEIPGAQHAYTMIPSIRSAGVLAAVARFLEWSRAAR